MNIKETHKYYYELAVKSNKPPCGDGSIAASVIREGTVGYIRDLIVRLDIKSINDCPSGLYENWMNLVDPPGLGVKYKGYDINDFVVERNKKNYPDLEFFEINMCEEILPEADLIICRDCLFHLPNQFVINTLNNFKKSGSVYLLATEQRWLNTNIELTPQELSNESGNKPINLEIEPFNLGAPIEFHDEKTIDSRGVRSLSLWKLN
jgi:hypothetical protein